MAFLPEFRNHAIEGRMDTIEYRGERIRLSRSYPSYEAYSRDPENIHPSERAHVAALVRTAAVPALHANADACLRAATDVKFPGYGIHQFGGVGGDASFIGQSIEIPFTDEERVLLFRRADDGRYQLVDDFTAATDTTSAMTSVRVRPPTLEYLDEDGVTLLCRPAHEPH